VFTGSRHWTLSWANWIHSTPSHTSHKIYIIVHSVSPSSDVTCTPTKVNYTSLKFLLLLTVNLFSRDTWSFMFQIICLFLLLRLCKRTSSSSRPVLAFREMLVIYGELWLYPSYTTPQAGGCLFHPQLEETLCHANKGPTSHFHLRVPAAVIIRQIKDHTNRGFWFSRWWRFKSGSSGLWRYIMLW